ncbi:hypothetical protein [Streptomyces sp. MUM 2J]|uniref:hypothetical protein n=1 Tax=Streptomyces sp. MUM 2J TaxID=2791987 RepID=UPI001F04370E|nr:hypothetical protein [Streptomyces sp. MUM 2J]MCH0567246.1 hypothetical protein [Streptomyces sp. MUM 2J]
MGDYNTGGFKEGGDGAVFGDPGTDPGSIHDYDSWDWKQIKAAIYGMSAAVHSAENEEHAKSVSNPQSLMDAAEHFYYAQAVLSGIAESIAAQAKALAGDDGPWKGDAADAFRDTMDTFSRQVKATAVVLSGGEAGNSVPQQLANNSVNLHNAKTKVSDIDHWYAHQARLMGVKPASNGLIPVHQRPELIRMMTSDMRAVLKSLVGEYQVTIDSVHTPPPVSSPTNPPNVPIDFPSVDDPVLRDPVAFPDVTPGNPPQFSAPGTSGLDGPGLPRSSPTGEAVGITPFSDGTGVDGNTPTLDGLGAENVFSDLSPESFPGSTGGFSALANSPFPSSPNTGTGDGLPLDSKLAGITPFSGGTGVDGNTPTLDGFKVAGLGNDTLDPSALHQALNPSAFPHGDNLDGGLPPFAVGPFPSRPNTGTGGGLPLDGKLAEDRPSWADNAAPQDFPGDTGVGGTGGLGAENVLGDFSPESFPGGLGTESDLPNKIVSPSALDDSLESPALGTDERKDAGGVPMMPGAGGMPMMPGIGAGTPGAGNTDRSDASGLLAHNTEPWTGDPSVAETIGSNGTQTGGDGLALPIDARTEALPGQPGTTQNEAIDTNGMPMMPGAGGMPMMPGIGAGTPGAGNTDRSDASGLLAHNTEPWTGDPSVAETIGSNGTQTGGDGLALPIDARTEALPGQPGTTQNEAIDTNGMPMMPGAGGMPMMPGIGAGTPGAGNTDRSDASGLLAHNTEPWTGDPVAIDEIVGGAEAGGEGFAPQTLSGGTATDSDGPLITPLSTPAREAPVAEPEGPTETAAGEPGMPGMMPGVGATSAGREEERADASGLLSPEMLPWSAEADPAGDRPVVGAHDGLGEGELPAALLGAAAGAAIGAGWADSRGGAAERRDRHQDDDAALVLLPMGGDRGQMRSATEEPDPEGSVEADENGLATEPVPPQEPVSGARDEPQLPDDHVALVRADGPEAEDTAAWDSAGASFAPLLWSARSEDEQEVLAPGWATEDESTWTGQAGPPAEDDGPRLSTWRPDRSAPTAPGDTVVPAVPLRSFAGDPSELTAELLAQKPVEDEDRAEDEQPSRGIADLLVQEGETWGSAKSDGAGAAL